MTTTAMPLNGAAKAPLTSRAVDRRRHQRVRVALLGRYMLSNRQEYPCQTIDVSPGGTSIVAPVRGLIGERIVIYVEHLGRIEGQVVRHTDLGLALTIGATLRKRDKLAAQLTWLANRHSLGLPEDRRHERVVPRHTAVRVVVEGGAPVTARIVDVSLSGAAVTMADRPRLGAAVTIGRTPGRVVRHFEGGIAVEFLQPLSPEQFDEGVVL